MVKVIEVNDDDFLRMFIEKGVDLHESASRRLEKKKKKGEVLIGLKC